MIYMSTVFFVQLQGIYFVVTYAYKFWYLAVAIVWVTIVITELDTLKAPAIAQSQPPESVQSCKAQTTDVP